VTVAAQCEGDWETPDVSGHKTASRASLRSSKDMDVREHLSNVRDTDALLKVGDAILRHNGQTVVIKERDTSTRTAKLYNFSVANTANYFVGDSGVLGHNAKKR